ncbi:unnamed protein product [Toxocara canis]|uniref:Ovule protein n=1 Tax=Toxocara canis TaxID=6265 RepID=A0A183U8K0_TOXCA|nr:unnamed protein product [Toxocara canis]
MSDKQKSSIGDSTASDIDLRGNGACKPNESAPKKSKNMGCDPAEFYGSSNGNRSSSSVLPDHLEADVKKTHEVACVRTKQTNKKSRRRRRSVELKCNQQFVVSSSPPASLDVRNNSKMDVSNGEARLNGLKSCEVAMAASSNCL